MCYGVGKGVYSNKARGGEANCTRSAKKKLNRKFKTFCFLDTWVHIHYTVQLTYKDYFISPSNKASRKKTANNVFNTLHSLVSDLKSVMALYRSR